MVYALVPHPEKIETLKHLSEHMDKIERPELLQTDILSLDPNSLGGEGLQTNTGINQPLDPTQPSIEPKPSQTSVLQESTRQRTDKDAGGNPQDTNKDKGEDQAGPKGTDVLQDAVRRESEGEDQAGPKGAASSQGAVEGVSPADPKGTDLSQERDSREGKQPSLHTNSSGYGYMGNAGQSLHSRRRKLLFEAIIGKDFLKDKSNKLIILKKLSDLLKNGGRLSIAELIPRRSMRLSSFVQLKNLSQDIKNRFQSLEEVLYKDPENPKVNWDASDLQSFFAQAGFSEIETTIVEYKEERYISEEDLNRWLNKDSMGLSYGRLLKEWFNSQEESKIRSFLTKELTGKTVEWKRSYIFLSCIYCPEDWA
jgi:hypothetical protein